MISSKRENIHLGPASPQRAVLPAAAKSHNLVVCGASAARDGFIFSDFMGYCYSLMQKGIYGTFLSCFPLAEHFAWLATQTNPVVTDIKFGKTSKSNKNGLVSYSKAQYEKREYWWQQIGPLQVIFVLIPLVIAKIFAGADLLTAFS